MASPVWLGRKMTYALENPILKEVIEVHFFTQAIVFIRYFTAKLGKFWLSYKKMNFGTIGVPRTPSMLPITADFTLAHFIRSRTTNNKLKSELSKRSKFDLKNSLFGMLGGHFPPNQGRPKICLPLGLGTP